MWLFSKSRTIAESGLLKGMTDYHCHILPGVDDGVKTMDESLVILHQMESQGIRKVLREHATENGTRPVERISLAVKELNMDRQKNPKQYPDSIYQKKLSDLKAGNLKDGKIPTLTIVIKPTDNASYKNMVDALDEMQISNIGTYVIDKINADDEKLLKSRNVKM